MSGKVAVTGIGAVSSLNAKQTWENALKGTSGIKNIEIFDASKLSVNFAGEVKNFSCNEEAFSSREAPRFDRFIQFAMEATHEAVRDSGFLDSKIIHLKSRHYLWCRLGGLPRIEETKEVYINRVLEEFLHFLFQG